MKKKTVALITLHRIRNYGSVLQTFVTQNLIQNLNYDVQIVDFYPKRMRPSKVISIKNNYLNKIVNLILNLHIYLKAYYIFSFFVKKELNLTKHIYTTDDDFTKYPIDADIYCTGSDQTWNTGWSDNKFEYPCFLTFAPDDKPKISFSASFGKEKLEEWEKAEMQSLLSRYDFISVREDNGVSILKDLDIESELVLDPTLMLTSKEWGGLIKNKYKNDKYILVYNLNNDSRIKAYAQFLSQKYNIKIYNLINRYEKKIRYAKNIIVPPVFDFVDLIYNAEFVITDSFHCTAFSLNLNKNLFVFLPQRFSSRLESIMRLTNTSDRILNSQEDFGKEIKEIDFEYVNYILNIKREESLAFLKKALQCKK